VVDAGRYQLARMDAVEWLAHRALGGRRGVTANFDLRNCVFERSIGAQTWPAVRPPPTPAAGPLGQGRQLGECATIALRAGRFDGRTLLFAVVRLTQLKHHLRSGRCVRANLGLRKALRAPLLCRPGSRGTVEEDVYPACTEWPLRDPNGSSRRIPCPVERCEEGVIHLVVSRRFRVDGRESSERAHGCSAVALRGVHAHELSLDPPILGRLARERLESESSGTSRLLNTRRGQNGRLTQHRVFLTVPPR
jgi:hypothetical protein